MLSIREIVYILNQEPSACAQLIGDRAHSELGGLVYFYQTSRGILLLAQVDGLPIDVQSCGPAFFGFHIHEGPSCTGTNIDPFADVGLHYNPHNCAHPKHAGDLPPIINSRGYALMVLLTSNFTLDEVIGRTIVVHSDPDDFTTQPDGNSGNKIACGVIVEGSQCEVRFGL